MQNTATYPEINAGTHQDTRAALNLAYLNYDSLTVAGQVELLPRMRAMHGRLEELGCEVPAPEDMRAIVFPSFPEINELEHREATLALKAAETTLEQVLTAKRRQDLDARVWALRDRIRRLEATACQIRSTQSAR